MFAAHRRAHDVVARHQTEDSVRAEIIGLCGSPGVDQLTFAVEELIAERLDLHVCDGVAKLVGDSAGDRAAARQAEVDLLERLSFGDIQGFAGLERARLSVLERHVSGLVDEKAIPPGWQRRKFVAPLAVGRDAPVELRLARVDVDLRAADRRARVGGDDAAADSRGACRRRRSCRAEACRRSVRRARQAAVLVHRGRQDLGQAPARRLRCECQQKQRCRSEICRMMFIRSDPSSVRASGLPLV